MPYTLLTDSDRQEMFRKIGIGKIDDLFADIPDNILNVEIEGLPEAKSEIEISSLMSEIGDKNSLKSVFMGGGVYNHYIPAVVDELASRSEFYTAYTPYQPEISQGTLTAIFEFQTFMCRLTGLDVTNASMYDGATSLAEAVMMAVRTNRKNRVVVSRSINPRYREVLKTYCWASDIEYTEAGIREFETDYETLSGIIDDETTAVVIQSPNFFGNVEDIAGVKNMLEGKKGFLINVVTEALSLGYLKSPGSLGADIVCGEAQSLGNYPAFGGPLLGFISAREKFMRKIPGRLAGKTLDSDGNEALALTLQAREQHIRREKATSNICSNEGLIALRAAIYMSLMGPGLFRLGSYNHNAASYLKEQLENKGFKSVTDKPFFNEFVVRSENPDDFVKNCASKCVDPGIRIDKWYHELENCWLFCATEINSRSQIDSFIDQL